MQRFALTGSCAEQTTVQGVLRLEERLAEHPRVDFLGELHHHGVPPGALGQHGSSPRAVTISSSLVPHRDHSGAQQHWGSLADLPPCTWGLLLTQHKSQTPCCPGLIPPLSLGSCKELCWRKRRGEPGLKVCHCNSLEAGAAFEESTNNFFLFRIL